jgi:hypothetical protein
MNATSLLDFLPERSLRTHHRDAASRATMAQTLRLLQAAQQAVGRTQAFLASCPEMPSSVQARNRPILTAQTISLTGPQASASSSEVPETGLLVRQVGRHHSASIGDVA